MQRFVLSIFSVVLATSAVAVNAQVLPQLEPSFNFQELRLRELDARNKSEDDTAFPYEQPPGQTPAWESPQQVWGEQEEGIEGETTAPETPDADSSQAPSLTERRLDALDRS